MTQIDVKIGPPRTCHRCGREALLSVDRPHSWLNARGAKVSGYVPVVLCSTCDHLADAAGPLIAFLTVYEKITDGLTEQFARYVRAWVEAMPPLTPDPERLRADEETWRRGDFDE